MYLIPNGSDGTGARRGLCVGRSLLVFSLMTEAVGVPKVSPSGGGFHRHPYFALGPPSSLGSRVPTSHWPSGKGTEREMKVVIQHFLSRLDPGTIESGTETLNSVE